MDVAQLVRGVVCATQVRTTRHTFAVRSPAELRGCVDPLRLEQVVANVLDNAIKYSPAGGPIDVSVEPWEGEGVRLAVRDRGLGIPPEKRHRVFERFYRAHDEADAPGALGLGLGLYISREIVERHGGSIAVDAPADGGTRLVVTLPLGEGGFPERACGGTGVGRPLADRMPARPRLGSRAIALVSRRARRVARGVTRIGVGVAQALSSLAKEARKAQPTKR